MIIINTFKEIKCSWGARASIRGDFEHPRLIMFAIDDTVTYYDVPVIAVINEQYENIRDTVGRILPDKTVMSILKHNKLDKDKPFIITNMKQHLAIKSTEPNGLYIPSAVCLKLEQGIFVVLPF